MELDPRGLQGIGIPWFNPDEWKRARALMPDAHALGQTHAEFVAHIERVEHQLRAQGAPFLRVPIDMDEFTAWCRLTGRQVNAKVCAEYAAGLARRHDDEGTRKG
jgi:hypothetical protein